MIIDEVENKFLLIGFALKKIKVQIRIVITQNIKVKKLIMIALLVLIMSNKITVPYFTTTYCYQIHVLLPPGILYLFFFPAINNFPQSIRSMHSE